jgi:uncharacterized protein (TIGR03435 family)
MNSDHGKLDETLKRDLPSAAEEEMVVDVARVLSRLRTNADRPAYEPIDERMALFERRSASSTWRHFAVIPAAAAIVLAMLFAVTWRQDAFAVVEKVEGKSYQVFEGKNHAIHVGERILIGTRVRTEQGAGAVLKLPDGARVEMHEQSEVVLEREKNETRIRLNDGSVNIIPSREPSGALVVQNRERIVEVTGTVFQSARPLAFEEASIRPSGAVASAGRGGIGATVLPNGCSLVSSQIDPRRFAVSEATLYTLIAFAYGVNFVNPLTGGCPDLAAQNLISGGSGWIKSDRWDVQAVIPEGADSYTEQQLRRGAAPGLQRMILTLLEDRFRLVVRRELKEVPAYALTAEPGAPRFVVRPTRGLVPGGKDDPRFEMIWGRAEPGIPKYEIGAMWGKNLSVADLIPIVRRETGRPVLDRTGLTNPFDFFLVYQANRFSLPGLNDDLPVMSKALEEQVGLKLQDTKTTIEVWVIDRAEKPSEN